MPLKGHHTCIRKENGKQPERQKRLHSGFCQWYHWWFCHWCQGCPLYHWQLQKPEQYQHPMVPLTTTETWTVSASNGTTGNYRNLNSISIQWYHWQLQKPEQYQHPMVPLATTETWTVSASNGTTGKNNDQWMINKTTYSLLHSEFVFMSLEICNFSHLLS